MNYVYIIDYVCNIQTDAKQVSEREKKSNFGLCRGVVGNLKIGCDSEFIPFSLLILLLLSFVYSLKIFLTFSYQTP